VTLGPRLLLSCRIFLALSCLFAGGHKAIAQHFYIQKYTANEGLPDSYVLNVYQDSQGFLWIGTVNGLSRWDGAAFFNYGYGEGLPSLSVDLMYEDHAKRLWAGTRKGMVEIRGGKCIVYPLDDHQSISYVFCIRDIKGEGLLALTDKGIYRMDSCQWKKLSFYPGFDDHPCRQLVETDSGLFINYGSKLVFRNNNGVYTSIGEESPKMEHYDQLVVCKGRLLLSKEAELFSLQQGVNTPLYPGLLRHKHLEGFFCDSRGRFWLGTQEDGLLITAPGNSQLITDTIPIAYNLLSSIYEDREGNIWVACFDGLLKIRDVHYTVFDDVHYPLLHNTRNLLKGVGQDLIAAGHAGLLSCKEGKFDGARLTPMPLLPPGSTNDDVIDFWCTDGQDRIWILTRRKKILLFDKNGLKDLSRLARTKDDWYGGIAFDQKNNRIYLSADSLFYGNEKGMHLFRDAETGQPIIKPRAIFYFDNGKLLVHTADNAFILVDSEQHTKEVSQEIGIPASNAGLCFCPAPCGRFWIGYNGGLIRCRWDRGQHPVQELKITTRDGLPNNAIHALVMDSLHRLWVITSSGLVVVEMGRVMADAGRRAADAGLVEDAGLMVEGAPVIHRLSEAMGISYDQWIQAKLLADGKGRIWMSFLNSVYRWDPGSIRFDRTAPSVAIEDIRINLRPTQWKDKATALFGYQQLPRQADLPYHLNNLSIAFKAPCFNGNAGIEYSYQMEGGDGGMEGGERMEGADSGWSVPSSNSMVTFVKIAPGNYHFKVRARKSDTGWGEPASFLFHIGRPWWESLWFRWLVILAIITLTALIFSARIRQIRRKALIREQLQELELRALRSQMNPHFIYNALNSIQALVVDRRPQEASLYIGKFGRLLRKILDHSEGNVITLREELEALELYIELERLRLNVALVHHIVIDPLISPGQEWMPPLILQPFVENALWHGLSRKTGEKRLDIHIALRDEWLVMRIIDNGIGRERSAALRSAAKASNTSKGIAITGRRIKEYNQGPEPLFSSITDLYDEEGQPVGTEVMLKIRRKRKPSAREM